MLVCRTRGWQLAALVRNTEARGDRVQNQHAAVWTKDGFVNLVTENESGSPLGAWGEQVWMEDGIKWDNEKLQGGNPVR